MTFFAFVGTTIGLLVLSFAGKVDPMLMAMFVLGGAVLVDLIAQLSRWNGTKQLEVMYRGLAEGALPQGVRDQLGRTALEALAKSREQNGRKT